MTVAAKTKISDAQAAARFENFDFDAATHRDHSATAEIRIAAKLRSDAEARVRAAVDSARAQGITWVEIGAALGVSHQAAMQRYKH